MRGVPLDLTGKKFGQWTVLYKTDDPSHNGGSKWRCKCSCGTEHTVPSGNLVNGRSRRCTQCQYRRMCGEKSQSHRLSRVHYTPGTIHGGFKIIKLSHFKKTKRGHQAAMYLCECVNCGAMSYASPPKLHISRSTSSKGCKLCTSGSFKISDEDVKTIRSLYPSWTLDRIAKAFNVDQSHVSLLVNNKRRKRGNAV